MRSNQVVVEAEVHAEVESGTVCHQQATSTEPVQEQTEFQVHNKEVRHQF